MVKRIVRIILARIAFGHDGIGRKIQKQTALFTEQLFQDLIQPVGGNQFADNEICADPQTAAAKGMPLHFRKLDVREVLQKIGVRVHEILFTVHAFPDTRVLGDGILLVRVIFTAIGVVNIGCAPDCFPGDPRFVRRDFHFVIQKHSGLLRALINTLLLYHQPLKNASKNPDLRL